MRITGKTVESNFQLIAIKGLLHGYPPPPPGFHPRVQIQKEVISDLKRDNFD
jgi:hypothetical protein